MMIVGYESFLEVADEVLKGIQGLRNRVIRPSYDEMVSQSDMVAEVNGDECSCAEGGDQLVMVWQHEWCGSFLVPVHTMICWAAPV
jgi:hypothetical protein